MCFLKLFVHNYCLWWCSDDQDSSKSIVGIAVGVPVGVLVLAACVVLLFIYRKSVLLVSVMFSNTFFINL